MKAFWITVAAILCAIILFVAFLPQLASTNWGKNLFVKIAFGDLSTKASVGTLRLSWLGPQQMSYFHLKDKNKEIKVEFFHADLSLFALFSFADFEPSTITKVNGNLEIQNGSFAAEWILENQAGRPSFNAMRRMETEHPIEVVGKKLRDMMPWLKG